ncbi:DUF2989 domain-containing protein [Thalassotalea fusca]
MKVTLVVLLGLATLSVGCDNGNNFATLCEMHPEICNEFEEDSWCKKERIDVGLANLADKEKPNELNKFNRLIAYESYSKCMAHASKIEHIKLKEKKTKRINNWMKAQEKIEELSNETKNMTHPRLLYFHWTRHLDEEALHKFLALEGTKAMENPESLFDLATYYIKRDPDKTLGLLYHALELYKPQAKINVEIFKSLSSIYADKNEPKQSYIWLKMLALYDPEDADITENTLINFTAQHNLDQAFLDKVAASTLDKIEEGQFKAPKY